MEDLFKDNAEQKDVITKRDSENLPGAGKPIIIENFYLLPPEFLFAHTVLKNSDYFNQAGDKKPLFPRPTMPFNNHHLFYGSFNSGLSNMMEELFKQK